MNEMEKIFSDIYHRWAWGGEESVSGPGSGVLRTSVFRDEIAILFSNLRVRSLLDAGCGDFNWMKELRFGFGKYIGVDIVPELIDTNAQKYGNEIRTFINVDITTDELPQTDAILCRDCLVHFSFADALAAIRNFKKSKSRYLLATTFVEFSENADIRTGEWRQLNLQRPPFNFPEPLKVIDEKCTHSGRIFADKRLGLWELASIAM
jgi:SAM-dependent methyltransferase